MRRLKRLRKKKGLTLDQLARRVGCSGPYIHMLETGKKNNPSLATLRRLAKALGVTIDELL